jgi:hypothetical protein
MLIILLQLIYNFETIKSKDGACIVWYSIPYTDSKENLEIKLNNYWSSVTTGENLN